MKKIILLASAFVFSLAVMAQSKVDEVLKFNADTHSFGKIKQGVPVTYFFELTNKSDKPVVIENATGSCGCTVAEKPSQPIMPGKTDKLKVVFNAAVVGPINKDVYVKLAGIDEQKILHITGEVLAADAAPANKN